MIKWEFNGMKTFIPPKKAYGFIYKIKYKSGKSYVGMKAMHAKKTLKALASGELREGAERVTKLVLKDEDGKVIMGRLNKAIARDRGLKAKQEQFDVLMVESKWRNYLSSSDLVKEDTPVSKEILEFAFSKRHLTYLETKYLFSLGVLETEDYYNENILGRFYKFKELTT